MAILVQCQHAVAKAPVGSEAPHVAVPNGAQSTARHGRAANPDGVLSVFEKPPDEAARELVVHCELAIFPARCSLGCADPEPAVTSREQPPDHVRRQPLIGGRLPWDRSNTIETKQAEVGTEPEVTIGRLCDR